MTASLAQSSVQSIGNTLQHFSETRQTSLKITSWLSAEDQMLQSMPDASPTKWHLAHTTWFFETFILLQYAPDYKVFDDRFQYLFNSYYKRLGSHPYRGSRGLLSRPSLEEVHAYRERVDQGIVPLLEQSHDAVSELIELGLNHEQQHQELILTDIKHALWSSPLRPPSLRHVKALDSAPALTWTQFDAGIYAIGHAGEGFAFDNEGPKHEVLLQTFQIASRAVTNGEYLQFMEDGGYRRPELWLSDGWDAVCAHGWEAPLYWEQADGGEWQQFALNGTGTAGMMPVNPAAPVCHVSFYEADAYARWCGYRLPAEQEWEVAAVQMPSKGSFLDDSVFHPQPAPWEGNQHMLGDVWQWTASPYIAYPGFRPAAGVIGEYNGKFMCNQLVLRGGSCATPANHIRATYRNFFPPQARWQFSGIRLAK